MWTCSQFQHPPYPIHFRVVTNSDIENKREEKIIPTQRPSPSPSPIPMTPMPLVFKPSTPTHRIVSVMTPIPTTEPPSLSKPTPQSLTPHHYNGVLVFLPSESGLGNNLYGLASAFLIAAMTNRELTSFSCDGDQW